MFVDAVQLCPLAPEGQNVSSRGIGGDVANIRPPQGRDSEELQIAKCTSPVEQLAALQVLRPGARAPEGHNVCRGRAALSPCPGGAKCFVSRYRRRC